MAGYSLELKRSAAKELEGVEPRVQRQRIVEQIRALAGEPRPHGSQKLAGSASAFRLRQGEFCIVCEIDDEARRVVVVKIGHRREVYR